MRSNGGRRFEPPASTGRGTDEVVERALDSTRALLLALEARDGYTGEHSQVVVALALATGRELELDDEVLVDLEAAARLHDIGKIAVPDAILNKAGELTESEWRIMRRHVEVGADLLAAIPSLSHLVPYVRAEHERWDGTGYPAGMAGDEIPLVSRIVLVADAYHAMTSDRPYRRALSHEGAVEEIQRNAGSQFCPTAAAAVLRVLSNARARGDMPGHVWSSQNSPLVPIARSARNTITHAEAAMIPASRRAIASAMRR